MPPRIGWAVWAVGSWPFGFGAAFVVQHDDVGFEQKAWFDVVG